MTRERYGRLQPLQLDAASIVSIFDLEAGSAVVTNDLCRSFGRRVPPALAVRQGFSRRWVGVRPDR